MNTKTALKSLHKIANILEDSGNFEFSGEITNVMKKIAQVVTPKNEFLQKHPHLLKEIQVLKTRKPKEGAIDIRDVYGPETNKYWYMPDMILENQVDARIRQLNDPAYQRELAGKRLKFLQNKLNSDSISPLDRVKLTRDVVYLKQFIGVSNLQDNPELNKKKEPQTAYEAMQMRNQEAVDSVTPKGVDYNQKVSELVIKVLKQAMPKKSLEEINLMLVGDLAGYKLIHDNPSLQNKLDLEVEKFANRFFDKEVALNKINNILSHKFARFWYK